MKKLFTLIVLVAATCFAMPASAQLKFGVKGGLNITDMSLSSDVLKHQTALDSSSVRL